MNKKITVCAGVAVLAIVIAIVGVKEISGDSAAEIPGEEHIEKTLHVQESNTTNNTTSESTESGSTESSESGP